jgi:hypothetical protein
LQTTDSSKLEEIILKESRNLKSTQSIDEEKNGIFLLTLWTSIAYHDTCS